jgi:alkanesulfonate monooxygenase SsuD/methylene tetrahydromethanopterin reductase-like flavin-dependent oxidoreductase (luciferase family)
MQYGLELSNAGFAGDARTLAGLAALAEATGWDGVFLEDYIVHWSGPAAPTYDPWVALAAMAVNTRRVRLGTTVTPLARRRPWKVARETVTLDHLSGGRLTLGVGLGDVSDPGFGAVGEVTDGKARAARLDEALDVLAGLWSGAPFSYQGAHFQVHNVTFQPRPVQTPRIPIWVGGNWPNKGPIARAARWDGFVGGKVHAPDADWHLTAAEVRTLKADIQRCRTSDAPFDLALGGGEPVFEVEQERAMIRAMAEAGATWWMEFEPTSLGSLEAMRARIARGPIRID